MHEGQPGGRDTRNDSKDAIDDPVLNDPHGALLAHAQVG